MQAKWSCCFLVPIKEVFKHSTRAAVPHSAAFLLCRKALCCPSSPLSPLPVLSLSSFHCLNKAWWSRKHDGNIVLMFTACINLKKVTVCSLAPRRSEIPSVTSFWHLSHMLHIHHYLFSKSVLIALYCIIDASTLLPQPSIKTLLRYFYFRLTSGSFVVLFLSTLASAGSCFQHKLK